MKGFKAIINKDSVVEAQNLAVKAKNWMSYFLLTRMVYWTLPPKKIYVISFLLDEKIG